MRRGLRMARAIDQLSGRVGAGVAWLTLAMIVLGAFNAVARYVNRLGFDLASNAYIEAQWYLFSVVFLLGAAVTLRDDAHVRVDVVYGRLGERARTWIDLVGTLAFLIPFSVLALVVSWPAVANSWKILEGSPDPGGLPRYPIKSLILVAFVLVILQGVAQAIRCVSRLRGNAADPEAAAASPESGGDA